MPADPNDRSAVETARTQERTANARRRLLLRQLEVNSKQEGELLRRFGAADKRLQQLRTKSDKLAAELKKVTQGLTDARQKLAARMQDWVKSDLNQDLGRLSTAFPIVMFPVRLEARFELAAAGKGLLRLRVYPDTVLSEAHDPGLTQGEYEAGVAYWHKAWSDEQQAWRELLRQTRAPRAAWIVKATTPTNLNERPGGQPKIPVIQLKPNHWEVPNESRVLPDRWLVFGFREGHEVLRAAGRPIQQPLATSFDPQSAPKEGIDVSGDGLRLDPNMVWTVDYARAEEAGMALSIELNAENRNRGFDRLIVFGVKGSLSTDASAKALAELIESHHYSTGMGFVAQGTPTNNTDGKASGYPAPDPDGARTFAVERGTALNSKDGDGMRLMRVLGIPANVAVHLEGSDRTEQLASRAMNQALWPTTWGYFLSQMMAPHLSKTAIAAARKHFVEFVRGRGPLPAFRVGGQPYGVLPVSSLERWRAKSDADEIEKQLQPLVFMLLLAWRQRISDVPRVGRSSDVDADLLEIFGMEASTQELRIRRVHGPDFIRNMLSFLEADPSAFQKTQQEMVAPLMASIGQPSWNPRILRMTMADSHGRFEPPIVSSLPLSETDGLNFDYIQWIRKASMRDLAEEKLPAGQAPPKALLYRLLRHAKLLEHARLAIELQIDNGLANVGEHLEAELVGVVDGTASRKTIWQRFDQPIPTLTGTVGIADFMRSNPNLTQFASLAQHDAALSTLTRLPTAELQRLTTETLDLCSHRLDAWITSLSTRRLAAMRDLNPTGSYLGAYGWLEDLRPRDRAKVQTVKLPDGRTVPIAANNGGYIHALSPSHAAATAVLRNAYRTRSGEQSAQFAIDLSSRRVRKALALLDAVREGQALGAILGYQMERGLHEGDSSIELSRFIEPLRKRFPLVANKTGDSTDDPVLIAARSVVDGLALLNAWKANPSKLPTFLVDGVPISPTQVAAVESELRRVDETVDSVADLLTAESVYKLVKGEAIQANASLDAIAKGARPPDPTICHLPQSATVVTHRVAIVLGANGLIAKTWLAKLTPRAQAEPFIDAWAGQLLGDPQNVRCRVRWVSANEVETKVVQVTLADLGLRPIDVLALTQESQDSPVLAGEFERRIIDAASRTATPTAQAEILYERDSAWPRDSVRAFPEILEVARTLSTLLAKTRPLNASDLAQPADSGALAVEPAQDPSSKNRAARAREALRVALKSLKDVVVQAKSPKIRTALAQASLFGIPSAYPPNVAQQDLAAITEFAESVQLEMSRRLEQADKTENAMAIVETVFGSGFKFLPTFVPANSAELKQALVPRVDFLPSQDSVDRWMFQIARVRSPISTWRKLSLYCRSLRTHVGTLGVVQLPLVTGERWVALPADPDKSVPPGRLSIVLHQVASPPPKGPWAGLVLDEWHESIPAKQALTGLAFHYDTPGSEAPQNLLIVAPPTDAPNWALEDMIATLTETLDLAKVRAVDSELLDDFSQMLPAIYLATNAENDTVSTDFLTDLVAERMD